MDWGMVDTLIRIATPGLIAWNAYLFSRSQTNRDLIHALELHIAKKYSSTEDLEKMFDRLEQRLEKRLDQFIKTLNKD